VSERYHRLYLIRPGRYDDAGGAYTCTGSLQVLDTRTGRPVGTPLVGKNPMDIIIDDPANRVFVVDAGARDDLLHGDIRLFNERTGALVAVAALDGAPSSAALAVHAGHLFVPLADVPSTDTHQALAVLGTGSGRLISLLPLQQSNDRPVADEATNRVFLHGMGDVVALNASTGAQVGVLKQWLCSGDLHDDAADGRIVALIAGASHNGVGSLCIFDPRTLRITGGWDYGPNAGANLVLMDGPAHLLFLQELTYGIGPPPAGITVRDSRNGHLIGQISAQFMPAAADPTNGNVIAVNRWGTAEILNPHMWKVSEHLALPKGSLRLVVSRNPHRLIVVSGSGDGAVVTFYAL
jgi:hypothetical protein